MTSHFPIWATLGLGFVLGLRHALDADHVAAVSTFVTEERDPWRSSLIGAFWGLGHTAALVVFGLAIAVFRIAVGPRLGQTLEFLVGCMLVYLGVRTLARASKLSSVHVHTHEHNGTVHSHLHFHVKDLRHNHEHRLFHLGRRPFVVGVVHGLSGTAATLLLLAGAIPSLLLVFGMLLIFGLGSIAGMVAMSVLMCVPLAFAARRALMLERVIRLGAGVFSLSFGILLGWNVGWVQSFFG